MPSTTTAPKIAGQRLEVDTTPVDTQKEQPSESSSQTTTEATTTTTKRGYHTFESEAYSLPNDEIEHNRLNIQDRTWKLCLHGGLHISPISPDVEHAMDIGTGTGEWAVDFARAHPACQVLGTDLSEVDLQPHHRPPPSNVKFSIANANDEEWNLSGQEFDFIHSRMLTLGVRDWVHYLRQAFKHTKPNGWVEVQETRFPIDSHPSTTSTTTSPLFVFSQGVSDASAKLGANLRACDTLEKLMTDIGFINVRAERLAWPVGPWPQDPMDKEIGHLTAVNLKEYFVPTLAPKLFGDVLGWSEDKVEDLVSQCRNDVDDWSAKKYYFSFVLCSGQKPPSSSS